MGLSRFEAEANEVVIKIKERIGSDSTFDPMIPEGSHKGALYLAYVPYETLTQHLETDRAWGVR